MREYVGRGRVVWGAVLLGVGLGGFFDGIVLHQILQWHHMVSSAGYPATSVRNIEINTLADGLFHAATYAVVLLGLGLLWAGARGAHSALSTKLLVGGLLVGWGAFNVADGVVEHLLLGVHHVNETVPRDQWIWWDVGFLGWGAVMLLGGLSLMRAGDMETSERAERGDTTRSSVGV